MKLKYKLKISYHRKVLDAIQQALGREDIGINQETGADGVQYAVITDMQSKELSLSTADEAKIRALSIVMEKLE